jgi:putative membrane protein
MRDGFLGWNATFMLDFVVCALVLVVPAILFSLYQVKIRRNFQFHRNLQLLIGAVLLVAVTAFEVDLQLIHDGWESVIAKRERPLDEAALARVRQILHVHLVFAISTPVLWALTIILALKRFPTPVAPGAHSRVHKTLGWLATVDITLTSVTGLVFYYFAFVR